MVKRRNFRKRRMKKRSLLSKGLTVARLAAKAYAGVRAIRKVINVERKYIDYSIAPTAIGTGYTSALLNGIAQGDTSQSRDGNSVLCQSIYMEGLMIGNAAASTNMVRVVVLKDKQQVADTDAGQPFVSNQLWSLYNDTLVPSRYEVLHDQIYHLHISVGHQSLTFSKTIPFGQHIKFNGTTAADIQKNGVYYYVTSYDNTNKPTVALNFRTHFTDN